MFPETQVLWFYLLSLLLICLYGLLPKNLILSTWIFHLTFVSISWTILFSRMNHLNQTNNETYFASNPASVKFQGKVLGSKRRMNGGYRYVLSLSHAFDKENKGSEASGLMLLYLTEAKQAPFAPGTIIQGEVKSIQRIPEAFNPGSFDQQNYWRVKRIFYKAYGSGDRWKLIQQISGSLYFRDKAQRTLSEIFEKALKDSISLGLINALLIGNKSGLSPEIMTDFKRTGAVHILAVSGLHVGILSGIIQFLLGFLPLYQRKSQVFSSCIFIFLLLGFSWLTQFEPAILRAAGGTILVVLSKMIQKTANPWNNLFAMACFLLLWEPNHLFHIGFQLSFVAVAGILAFYQSWVQRCSFKNKLIAYFWEMTVMGFAAQWVTLPLLLYHFHQFSWLFLVSGWIAIPLSTFILGFSLFYLVISFIPPVSALAGEILEWSILLFRTVMSRLSSIPWAVSEGIYLSPIALIFLAALVLTLAYAIECRKRNVFICSLCMFLSIFQFSFLNGNKKGAESYILSERNNAILTLRSGNAFHVYANKPVDKKRQDLLYLGQWATDVQYHILPEQILSFPIKTGTLVKLDGARDTDFVPFGTHWWVVTPLYGDWEQWLTDCPPEVLILNGTLPFAYRTFLKGIAGKFKIKVVDTYASGAYSFKSD